MIFLFKLYFYVKIDDLELNKKGTPLIMCSSIQHTLFYISRNIDFLLKNAIFDRLNFLVHFLQENKVKICKSMIFWATSYFYVKIDVFRELKKGTQLIMCSSIQHSLFLTPRSIDFLLKNAIFDRLKFLVHFLQENKVKICKSMFFSYEICNNKSLKSSICIF